MKKILVISQYFRPDITAAAFRIADLYTALKNNNLDVDVITTYPHKSDITEFNDNEDNIMRVNINKKFNNKFIKYLYEYFYFMIMSIFKSFKFKKKKYDYVFVTSPPIFIFISGFIVAKIKKSKIILDVRDIWPGSAVSAGMIEENGIIYKLIEKLEVFMYKKSDIILCVSENMKEHICNYVDDSKVTVVYNGVSNRDIQNVIKINSLNKDKKQCRSKKKIYYAGNIGLVQNLDILINTFINEKSLQEKYEIHFIGDGAERTELESLVKDNQLENNIFFKGSMSKEKTIEYMSLDADILFFSLKPDKVLDKTIPSKLFDYLMFNKPIIYGINGEGKDILNNLNCGLSFVDEQSLSEVLYKMYNNYDLYKNNSVDNLNYVKENFNRIESFEHMIELL